MQCLLKIWANSGSQRGGEKAIDLGCINNSHLPLYPLWLSIVVIHCGDSKAVTLSNFNFLMEISTYEFQHST